MRVNEEKHPEAEVALFVAIARNRGIHQKGVSLYAQSCVASQQRTLSTKKQKQKKWALAFLKSVRLSDLEYQ